MTSITSDIEEVADVIRDGGIAVIPTDTCYGLAAPIKDKRAVKRIFNIKKRPLSKPVISNISSTRESRELSDETPPFFEDIAEEFWPGPLTLILPASSKAPSILMGNTHKIALRLPDYTPVLKLIEKVGTPVTSTSANISGYNPVYQISRLDERIKEMSDIILNRGELTKTPPSTLLDLTAHPPRLIRKGEIEPKQLKEITDLETIKNKN